MRPRKAFTLVELLVCLIVVGIIVALLAPVLAGAVRRANEAAALAEDSGLASALTLFKSTYGNYPPSRVILDEGGDYSEAHVKAALGAAAVPLIPRSVAAIRGFWPRVSVSSFGPPALPNGFYDFNGDGVLSPPVVLDGRECLVFFLGGTPLRYDGGIAVTGFASNQANPFAAGATNRKPPLFTFDPHRLVDLDGDGFPEYASRLNGKPLAYFAAYPGGSYDPDDVDDPSEPLGVFQTATHPTGTGGLASRPDLVASRGPNPYHAGAASQIQKTVWLKPDSFQIVDAGYDGLFGPGGGLDGPESYRPLVPPDPSLYLTVAGVDWDPTARDAEQDNVTSFRGFKLGK